MSWGRFERSLVLIGLASLLLAGTARAQVSDANRLAAEALFNDGRRLLEEGDYAAACPKLRDSQELDPGVGTLLNLARCYLLAGQTASAWSTYREAAAAARDAEQPDRESHAREEARKLESQLSRLQVTVPERARVAGFEVRVNGELLPEVVLGVPMPTDPGEHRLEATAPGHAPWSRSVRVEGTTPVVVEVPALQSPKSAQPTAPPSPPNPPAAAAPRPAPDPPPAPRSAPEADPGTGDTQRTWGLVLGGVGVAGLGVGGVLAVLAQQRYDQSLENCRDQTDVDVCSPEGAEQRQSAEDLAGFATIGALGGAALLAGGAILYFTAPDADSLALGVRVTPARASLPWSLQLGGTW